MVQGGNERRTTGPHEDPALAELLRLGERLIDIQLAWQHAVERRAADLMKVTVASLGAVAVIVGFVRTTTSDLSWLPSLLLALATLSMLCSAFSLATILVGERAIGGFAFGPRLRNIVDQLDAFRAAPDVLRESVVRAMPAWVDANDRVLALQTRRGSFALWLLALGAGLAIVAIAYIFGATIHA